MISKEPKVFDVEFESKNIVKELVDKPDKINFIFPLGPLKLYSGSQQLFNACFAIGFYN